VGGEKLYVRGATYGAFEPNGDGAEYHDRGKIDRDFAQMAAVGLNAVRIPHTMPPRELLDIAREHGLWVMVGLSAEQYVGYLADPADAPDVDALVREKAASVAGHPALLCYSLGNEIPAPLARWLGARRVERYLRRLAAAVRETDPGGLVTYVNYPSTEYLRLDFLDLLSFNVYLEEAERLEAYLARLHNIAGDRPLLMSELGLDSFRNGLEAQASAVEWQLRTTFACGAGGGFVFSWTDEWFRAGEYVEDWAFGLTDAERRPKPAQAAARRAFAEVPFPEGMDWPKISVIVCAHEAEATIGECLESTSRLDYPDYEVIVVDDGSSDRTAAIAADYPVRTLSAPNQGLSAARNRGLSAASGEIVAYLDADAHPDRHWLRYLAFAFADSEHVGIGGPNVPPPDDPPVAHCVASAPGGPIHVLLSDTEAEHIPGCNMAFRTASLREIGGFDQRFRAAGDDVDVCWRLRDRGWTLGFSPAAMVWHHRRDSVKGYLRQQHGYGRAEALLEEKWRARHNGVGHVRWTGRIYGRARGPHWGRKPFIYHGMWGSAPFQSLYEGRTGPAASMLDMPEWWLLAGALGVLSLLGALWTPLLIALPLFALAVAVAVGRSVVSGVRAPLRVDGLSRRRRLALRSTTVLLHLAQPLARLGGRVGAGLSPLRRMRTGDGVVPRPHTAAYWTEAGREQDAWLRAVAGAAASSGVGVAHGGDFDRWDLEIHAAPPGAARLLVAVEDHGGRRQLVRTRIWPWVPYQSGAAIVLFAALGGWAALDGAVVASALLVGVAAVLALRAVISCAQATGALLAAVRSAVGERSS
jgi:O-antigen biosynthesis protein